MPISTQSVTYPDWVHWIAQNKDGHWWGYSIEPLQHDHGWYENEVGNYILLAKKEPNKQWKQSLQKIKN